MHHTSTSTSSATVLVLLFAGFIISYVSGACTRYSMLELGTLGDTVVNTNMRSAIGYKIIID